MARRSKQSVLVALVEMPWQASVVCAVIVYLGLRFALPAALAGTIIGAGVSLAARELAWIFGALFLIPAPFAAFRQHRRKKLFDAQADIESIRALSWQQFEKLVAEVFHRMGYSVIESGGASPDGGVDLVARSKDEKLIVQCKHWRSQSVGVSIVREHYGVMTHECATGGAIVATGAFTPDAIAFAHGKPIQLINGSELEKLVLSIRGEPTQIKPESNKLICPKCDSSMVKRTARRGQFAGATFWGCSQYPVCRGTRRMT